MIITDKDGCIHSVNTNCILFAQISIIDTTKITILLDNGNPSIARLGMYFATKEEAEAVLKQIDARMEHPLQEFCTREHAPALAMPEMPPLHNDCV